MNNLDWNTLPIIDWELGMRLAGNQSDLAEDMIAMLKKTLPDEFAEIKNHAALRNYNDLLRCVHKLHGAASYCGTPRLKALLAVIEMRLKHESKENEIDGLIVELDSVVDAVSKS